MEVRGDHLKDGPLVETGLSLILGDQMKNECEKYLSSSSLSSLAIILQLLVFVVVVVVCLRHDSGWAVAVVN